MGHSAYLELGKTALSSLVHLKYNLARIRR